MGKLVVWICVCISVTFSPLEAQRTERSANVLHSHMARLLHERGPSKGWVFLTDKGMPDEATLRVSLDRARLSLTRRALERRYHRRTAPGLVDVRDVPVHPPYVDRIVAEGVELFVESHWLNAVSVRGTRAQFERLAELPFVARIEPVRRGMLLDSGWSGSSSASPVAVAGPKEFGTGFYGLSGPQLAQLELSGQIVDFSSDGPTADGRVKPELLALGRLVMTNCAHADVDCTTDTGGTSFATPLIASVVACLLQAHPLWTPAQMRARLFFTASDYRASGTTDPLFVRGYGIPDAFLAGFPEPMAEPTTNPLLGPILRQL